MPPWWPPAVCVCLQGPLPLFSWSDGLACATSLNVNPGGAPIHGCSDLAQLAMWLGVGKVRGGREAPALLLSIGSRSWAVSWWL